MLPELLRLLLQILPSAAFCFNLNTVDQIESGCFTCKDCVNDPFSWILFVTFHIVNEFLYHPVSFINFVLWLHPDASFIQSTEGAVGLTL